MYHTRGDDLVVADTNYLDSRGDQDAILELVIELKVKGYPELVVHAESLSNGLYFFGINYKACTPKGQIYERAQAAFHRP